MKRRTFLDLSVKTAASVALFGCARPRSAFAQGQQPHLFIMFDARGGWDTSRFLDPYGGEPYSAHYAEGDILTLGGTEHRYAPKSVNAGTPVPFQVGAAGDKQDFFARYGNEMVVFNGVDTQTNSHDVGPRHVWSGNIRPETPALSALYAAVWEDTIGATLPMALLSTGGYDDAAGLLPPSRVGQVSALLDISQPYRIAASNENNLNRFLPPEIETLVRQKNDERQARLAAQATLPHHQAMVEALDRARSAEPAFAPLHAEFLALPALDPDEESNPLTPKAQVALAAMRAGVCVSAMVSLNGFDTHGDHDTLHPARMQELLDAIDYTARTLESLGLRDRATIVVGADFARTIYNDTPANTGRGKDHWPITSMMVLGAGVAGGRRIGLTERHDPNIPNRKGVVALPVKVVSGEVVTTTADDPEGFMLRPPHIHDALRELAGIRDHPFAEKFYLDDQGAQPLPLLA